MPTQPRDENASARRTQRNGLDEVGAELQELRASLAKASSNEEIQALLEKFSARVDRLEREFKELRAILTRVGPSSAPS